MLAQLKRCAGAMAETIVLDCDGKDTKIVSTGLGIEGTMSFLSEMRSLASISEVTSVDLADCDLDRIDDVTNLWREAGLEGGKHPGFVLRLWADEREFVRGWHRAQPVTTLWTVDPECTSLHLRRPFVLTLVR